MTVLLPELPATPGKIQVECSSVSRIETKNQLNKQTKFLINFKVQP